MKKLPALALAVTALTLAACETDPNAEPTYECDLVQTELQQVQPLRADMNGDGWVVICLAADLGVVPDQVPPVSTVYGP